MSPRLPRTTALLLAVTTLMACDRGTKAQPAPEPAAAPLPAPSLSEGLPQGHPPIPPPAAAMPPAAQKKSDLSWTDPGGWKREQRGSAMRLATYSVPKAGGDTEDAELAVFYFGPGAAGGIEANVQRWVGQFEGATMETVERDQRNVNGLHQHIVAIAKGKFSSGMPAGPTSPQGDFGLLAAIVEAPTGAHFFKMTGPAKTVAAARPAFLKMMDSVKVGTP